MAASNGRAVNVTWNSIPLGGAREKNVECNAEPVDISDSASNGWRELLSEAGSSTVDVSIAGVTKSDMLKKAWFSSDKTASLILTYPDGGSLTMEAFLVSYSEGMPYNDAITYDASFQSTGNAIYTPAV